ncbi:hypothetical protein PLANTIT3_30107 [Plantibacter sp. T3]|nr:hypothetical protein PLANTIT3_30107 [Plantibacter sp. T3]
MDLPPASHRTPDGPDVATESDVESAEIVQPARSVLQLCGRKPARTETDGLYRATTHDSRERMDA